MKPLVRVATAFVSIAALARLLAGRRRRGFRHSAPPPTPDPAAELKRKLAETRSTGMPDVSSQVDPDAQPPRMNLDERRARVHAKAQEALDEMRVSE
ncbi:MAG: hypothetical protein ACKVUT_18155 [Gaiella sp.]